MTLSSTKLDRFELFGIASIRVVGRILEVSLLVCENAAEMAKPYDSSERKTIQW